MAYQKQTWRDYDDDKTELQNLNNGALVTPERMNHIETGIANSVDQSTFEQNKVSVEQQLQDKPDKSDLQGMSLAYKESYDTLAALRLAYPTGDDFNHVVLADKIIYTYKNSWVSTGIQANGTGIADYSVLPQKTSFMIPTDIKIIKKDLITFPLGIKGDFYDPANGLLSNSDFTQTFKPTKIIQLTNILNFESLGVSSWVFYKTGGAYVGKAELSNDDMKIYKTVDVPLGADYMIGNVKDWFFPIDDPDRSPYPQGVASAQISTEISKYKIRDIIVDEADLSDELKEKVQSGAKGYENQIIVSLGDSIIAQESPSVSDIIADELGATTINGGFGGTMFSTHPNAQYAKFSVYNIVNSIVSGDWSLQLNAAEVPQSYRDKALMLSKINWNTVNIMTMSSGTNDFPNSNPIDNPLDKYDVAAYLGAIRYSVKKIREKHPHIKILLTAPIFRSTNDRTENAYNWTNGNGKKLIDFVDSLEIVRKEICVPVADTFYGLGINEWNEGYYFSPTDGTHPNGTYGIPLLSKNIANSIRMYF